MKVLLIEDEQPAARQMTKLLGQLDPPLVPIEVIDSVESSVRWLRTFPTPDLIFMDIQISDGLSFEILQQIPVSAPIVFTTAFDHYAIQAFKVNAVDYLLKPIEIESLRQAVARVEERRKTASTPSIDIEALYRHFAPPSYKDRFLVRAGQSMLSVATSDIAFFRSDEGLTQAFTDGGKKYFVEHTLEELERLIDPKAFFRVSRQVILRLDTVKAIHNHFNGRLKVDVNPAAPDTIFVSRDRVSDFKAWLGG
jgi:DNA-binding LytR/AlgR family response regulator